MSDGTKHAAQPKADVATDPATVKNSAANLIQVTDAGPGKVALELSGIKERLHDLGTDKTIPRCLHTYVRRGR
jgi:hypothetical protein